MSQSLTIRVRGRESGQDALVDMLSVDFNAYWQPEEENYFKRLKVGGLLSLWHDLTGSEYESKDKSKCGIAVRFTEWYRDTASKWLPKQF